MRTAETLVSLEHKDGTAGVFRDEKGFWLTGQLGQGGTLLADYRPAVEGLPERRTAQGGRLPPGAVAAEVVDDLGERRRAAAENGAWVVVLDQPTQGNPSPVRFLDERGETVTPPLPADWPRSPVPDSDEACPACGACAWDEVRPLDGSRGMSGAPGAEALPFPVPGRAPEFADIRWEPTPFVVCRVCGHERSLGVSLTISTAGDGDPAEAERQFREFENDRRRAEREALAGAAFPIYAPEDLEVTLNGWGGPPSGVNRVTVTHYDGSGAELSIETRSGEAIYGTEKDLVLEALEELLLEPSGGWPRGSEAAATIWLEAREQEDRANRRRLMSAAQVRRCELVIDGSQEPFELATAGGRWAAALRRDDSVVIVTSTGGTARRRPPGLSRRSRRRAARPRAGLAGGRGAKPCLDRI